MNGSCMLLIGNIRQIKELAKRAGNNQELLFLKRSKELIQSSPGVAFLGLLGTLANVLDPLKE